MTQYLSGDRPAQPEPARPVHVYHTGLYRPEENEMARKYGPKADEKVEKAMHEFKRGELKSGSTGKTVTNKKQAIAIGLSEARKAGGKVPPKKK